MVEEAGWQKEEDLTHWLDVGKRYALSLPRNDQWPKPRFQ